MNKVLRYKVLTVWLVISLLSLSCQFVTQRFDKKVEPIQTVTELEPTQQVPNVLHFERENQLSITHGTNQITLEISPGDEDAAWNAEEWRVGDKSLVFLTNYEQQYLPELHWLSLDQTQTVDLIPRRTQNNANGQSDYAISVLHQVDINTLMKEPIGETTLDKLTNLIKENYAGSGGALLMAVPEMASGSTQVMVYKTPLTNVFLAVSTTLLNEGDVHRGPGLSRPKPELLIGALVVLVFVVVPLIPIVERINAQSQPVMLIDFTGATTDDIAMLKFRAAAYAMGRGGGDGGLGEGAIIKVFSQAHAKKSYLYIEKVQIVKKPCGNPEFIDKIFSQEPAPGTEIIPNEDPIILYLCQAEDFNQVQLQTITFSPDTGNCPISEEREGLNVVMVIDTSGSMQGTRMAVAKSSAIKFIQFLNTDTDQIGLVSFESDAVIQSYLTNDFEAVISSIGSLEADGGTSIDTGLASGYEVLQNSGSSRGNTVMFLLSDGQSDAEEAIAEANRIKNDGVVIYTAGVGEGSDLGLLRSLASDSENFFYSKTNQDLRNLFSNTAAQLTANSKTAEDVEITVEVDQNNYLLVDTLLSDDAQVLANGKVEWQIPAIYDGQEIQRILPIIPINDVSKPVGRVTITYNSCDNGAQITQGPDPLVFVEASSDVVTTNKEMSDTLEPFGTKGYATVLNKAGTYSFVISGAGSELVPEVQTGDGKRILYPIYQSSVDTEISILPGGRTGLMDLASTDNRRISVYQVEEPMVYWTYIQSNSEEDSGDFVFHLVEGEAANLDKLEHGETKSMEMEESDTAVFEISKSDAKTITFTVTHGSEGYVYLNLVNMDQSAIYETASIEQSDEQFVSVFQVNGAGTYRLMAICQSGECDQVKIGFEQDYNPFMEEGSLETGNRVNAYISRDQIHQWNYSGKASEVISLSLTSNSDSRKYIKIFDPDLKLVISTTFYSEREIDEIALSKDGNYQILVYCTLSENCGDTIDLSIKSENWEETEQGQIEDGETVEGVLLAGGGGKAIWRFQAEAGQWVSVLASRGSESSLSPTLQIVNLEGEVLASTKNTYYTSEAELPAILILNSGEYQVFVGDGYWYGGKYDLTLNIR